MAIEHPGAQNHVAPSQTIDEYSPLLHKTNHNETGEQTTHDDGSPSAESKKLATSSLLWIVSSVWIGTFTAGLGKHDEVQNTYGGLDPFPTA